MLRPNPRLVYLSQLHLLLLRIIKQAGFIVILTVMDLVDSPTVWT
jgi:hypothetical protein